MTASKPVQRTARYAFFRSKPGLCRHRRAVLRPTRYGWVYLVLLVAMLGGSVNYGNNFGFLLTFLLAGVGTVSLLHTWRSLRGIALVSARAAPVFAGEQAVFDIVVRGGSEAVPAVEIGIENMAGPGPGIDLAAERNQRLRVSHPAPQRGRMITGACTASSTYPLGFFRGRVCLAAHFESLVYPAPLKPEHLPPSCGSAAGTDDASAEIRSGSDDFQGLNAYRPGDPVPRISWKASSRGQGLYTKEFSGAGGGTRMLDWHALTQPDPEQKLSILCGQVLDAERRGFHYGLKIPGRSIPPGRGDVHRHRCLAALAEFPASDSP